MQNNRSSVGPRGLAMITLVGGAALASPFLRPPQVDLVESISESPLAHPGSPGRLASAQLPHESFDQQPPHVTNLPELFDTSSSAARLAEPQFPAWATPPSPLDHVISKGTAPTWRHATEADARRLEPLQSWVGGTTDSGMLIESQSEVRQFPSTRPPQALSVTLPPGATTTLREPTTAQALTPQAIGSLTATSQLVPYHSSSNQIQPQPSPPAASKFVYQPGFRRQAPGPK